MQNKWLYSVRAIACLLFIFGAYQLRWVYAYFVFPRSDAYKYVQKISLSSIDRVLLSLQAGKDKIETLDNEKKIILRAECEEIRQDALEIREKILMHKLGLFPLEVMLVSLLSSGLFCYAGVLIWRFDKRFKPFLVLSLVVEFFSALVVLWGAYVDVLPMALLGNKLLVLGAKISDKVPPPIWSKFFIAKGMFWQTSVIFAAALHLSILLGIFLFFQLAKVKEHFK